MDKREQHFVGTAKRLAEAQEVGNTERAEKFGERLSRSSPGNERDEERAEAKRSRAAEREEEAAEHGGRKYEKALDRHARTRTKSRYFQRRMSR